MKAHELAKLLLDGPNLVVWLTDYSDGNDWTVRGLRQAQPPSDACNPPKQKLDDVILLEIYER